MSTKNISILLIFLTCCITVYAQNDTTKNYVKFDYSTVYRYNIKYNDEIETHIKYNEFEGYNNFSLLNDSTCRFYKSKHMFDDVPIKDLSKISFDKGHYAGKYAMIGGITGGITGILFGFLVGSAGERDGLELSIGGIVGIIIGVPVGALFGVIIGSSYGESLEHKVYDLTKMQPDKKRDKIQRLFKKYKMNN